MRDHHLFIQGHVEDHVRGARVESEFNMHPTWPIGMIRDAFDDYEYWTPLGKKNYNELEALYLHVGAREQPPRKADLIREAADIKVKDRLEHVGWYVTVNSHTHDTFQYLTISARTSPHSHLPLARIHLSRQARCDQEHDYRFYTRELSHFSQMAVAFEGACKAGGPVPETFFTNPGFFLKANLPLVVSP